MRPLLLLLNAILFFHCSLNAEIESITIRWTAGLCKASCGKGLEAQFRKIPAVADVSVDINGSQATLHWRPDVRFTFLPIETAMQLIGLSIEEARVRVKGKIVHDAQNVRLISSRDQTQFELVGPIRPVANQYVEQFNLQNRALSAELRDSLLDAQDKQKIVTIDGPLFMPENSPPLYLVVEKVSFAKEPEKPK